MDYPATHRKTSLPLKIFVWVVAAIACGKAADTKQPPTASEASAGTKQPPTASEASADAKQPQTVSAKPVDGNPAAEVTAGVLYEDYKANAIGADTKYRDKLLRVTGVVDRVGKQGEKPFVVFWVLEAADDGVRANFSTAAGLAQLKRFQTVAARCRAGSSAGLPTLSECVFERVIDE